MDNSLARVIAEEELVAYRNMSYDSIRRKIGYPESFERVSDLGEPYQIEIDFFYDNHKEGNIRVVAAVSFNFWTDFSPVSSDFIIAQTGDFIGE